MKDRPHRLVGGTANADIVVDRTFWVGLYPGLGRPHLDYMIDRIRSFVRARSRLAA